MKGLQEIKINTNNVKERVSFISKIKHKGDEFIGKALLIILALIIGGIFITAMKSQFTNLTTKTGNSIDNFFNQID